MVYCGFRTCLFIFACNGTFLSLLLFTAAVFSLNQCNEVVRQLAIAITESNYVVLIEFGRFKIKKKKHKKQTQFAEGAADDCSSNKRRRGGFDFN